MSDLFLDEVIRPDQADDGRSRRRANRDDRERTRRKRRRRSGIALLVSLLLLGGAAWVVVQYVMPLIDSFTASDSNDSATDYPGPGRGSVQVVIPQAATGAAMAEILYEAGVVGSERAFTMAFSANASAPGIQPGTYTLQLEMKASDAVNALLDAENRVQTKVTIAEGLTVDQTLEKLASVTAVPVEDFKAAMEDTEATGLPAEAGGSYEGWMFPDTYIFEPGTEPVAMVRTMVGRMIEVLDERGVAPEDRKTVLTKASLVERESPNAEASPKMARAIQNRLDRDWPLDIDAAVAFGLGKSGTELTSEDVSREATDNKYNLYAHLGLPPTPIAAPGVSSIEAVLDPAEGEWMFWVTINLETGETRFAETNDEHNQNRELLREWQESQE